MAKGQALLDAYDYAHGRMDYAVTTSAPTEEKVKRGNALKEARQAVIDAIDNPPARTCKWSQDGYYDEDNGKWNTSCGESFYLSDGTPNENSMKFCPFCGARIESED